jgi:hypothetical protein
MKTVTRGEAARELAAIPGYSDLTARNILHEARYNPYVIVNCGALFIAHADDGRYVLADVERDGSGNTDGAAFAALLTEAKAAGASRVSARSPLPAWC